jgi:hypothetical protein
MGNKKLADARVMKSATNHKMFNETLIRERLKKTSQNS